MPPMPDRSGNLNRSNGSPVYHPSMGRPQQSDDLPPFVSLLKNHLISFDFCDVSDILAMDHSDTNEFGYSSSCDEFSPDWQVSNSPPASSISSFSMADDVPAVSSSSTNPIYPHHSGTSVNSPSVAFSTSRFAAASLPSATSSLANPTNDFVPASSQSVSWFMFVPLLIYCWEFMRWLRTNDSVL